MLIASSQAGAYTLGSDIDFKLLHGLGTYYVDIGNVNCVNMGLFSPFWYFNSQPKSELFLTDLFFFFLSLKVNQVDMTKSGGREGMVSEPI